MPVVYLPSDGNVTSAYGIVRSDGKEHDGIDFGWGNGTKVYATEDAEVTKVAKLQTSLGNHVFLRPLNGNEFIRYVYGHLDEIWVTPEDIVEGGKQFAVMGNTGNSTAVHLHFEVRLYDEDLATYAILDPCEYLGIVNKPGEIVLQTSPSPVPVKVKVELETTVLSGYTIDDVTHVSLRDIAALLTPRIDWSPEEGAKIIIGGKDNG